MSGARFRKRRGAWGHAPRRDNQDMNRRLDLVLSRNLKLELDNRQLKARIRELEQLLGEQR